jgi:D-glycero-D-manno-heptose 1,7-bisphosphate phosphatase
LKDLLTIVRGNEAVKKNLQKAGLGEILFIKDRSELFEKVSKNQNILYLELPDGLNFDLSYFLRFATFNSIGLFYQKNSGNSFFLLDKELKLKEMEKSNSYYFDGLIPCGAFLSSANYLSEFFKGNYLSFRGISLGRHQGYQDEKKLKGALFLDRDGIINVDLGYVFEADKVVIYEDIIPLIKAANEKEMPVIVLTNQSGIAKGWYKEEDVVKLHHFLQEEINLLGGKIDGWFYSPFHPTEGIGEYKKESLLRKPGPGMALLACELFPIDLSKSYMVGDKLSDNLRIPGLNCLNFKRGYDLSGSKFPTFESYKEIKDSIFGPN